MNILINCSNLKIGGGLQVAQSFLNHIVDEQEDKFIVVLSSMLAPMINQSEFPSNFSFYKYDIKAGPISTVFSKNIFLDKLILDYEIDRVFSIFGPTYWRPKVLHISGYAKAQYIYKDSPYFKQIGYKELVKLKIKEFFHLHDFKKNSDLLITENSDVTLKISQILKKKSFTVNNNYNQVFDYPDRWKIIEVPQFHGKYILTISVNYSHKNLNIIPKVIKELLRRGIKNYKFMVSLNKGDLQSCTEVDEYILYLGKVKVDECPHLYKSSSYMFLPTLLECFSASYTEAMKSGVIILTSELPFATSICKNSAVYFDPLDPIDIVNKLLEIDHKPALQDELINNGFKRLTEIDSSRKRAKKYLKIIKES